MRNSQDGNAPEDKSAICVELAGYFMRSATTHVKKRVLGRLKIDSGYRKDFEIVFNKGDRRLSDFREASSVTEKVCFMEQTNCDKSCGNMCFVVL